MAGRGSVGLCALETDLIQAALSVSCGGAVEVERLRIEEGSRCLGETVGPIGISLPL